MNLQEFVRETMTQIAAGVAEAKKVNPQIAPLISPNENAPPIHRSHRKSVLMVDFDVAVTVSDKTETGGGGGVTVVSVFKAEGKRETITEHSSVSRIKFSVPISYEQMGPVHAMPQIS